MRTSILKYGRGEVHMDLSGYSGVSTFAPKRLPGECLGVELLDRSLRAPVSSAPLSDVAAGKKKVTIAIPDKTRPPIARDLLPHLIQLLQAAGVPGEGIRLFISCGTHAAHSDGELESLIGKDLMNAFEVHQNDAYDSPAFVNLGSTSRGTPVEVNRVLVESDLVVVIGGHAFHYFAGFTGGRKMIIPGGASAATVESNHRLTLRETGEICPGCGSGILDGNPVHLDMVEAAAALPKSAFLINVIQDGWGRIADIVSGDLTESHLACTGMVRDLFECRLGAPCDIAIASAGGYPMDVNMIQSHKSLEHAAVSVREGGVVIGVLECGDGIGSDTFMQWFEYGNSAGIIRKLYDDYALNGHTALSFMQKLERVKIILVTDLDRDLVERMGALYAKSADEALALAGTFVNANPQVYIFPIAWGLLPVLGK